jgi:hypothetical protein
MEDTVEVALKDEEFFFLHPVNIFRDCFLLEWGL